MGTSGLASNRTFKSSPAAVLHRFYGFEMGRKDLVNAGHGAIYFFHLQINCCRASIKAGLDTGVRTLGRYPILQGELGVPDYWPGVQINPIVPCRPPASAGLTAVGQRPFVQNSRHQHHVTARVFSRTITPFKQLGLRHGN